MAVAAGVTWLYWPKLHKSQSAAFDEAGIYRYALTRIWDTRKPILTWVMLNPSTASAFNDDATIRRCVWFARDLGCGGIIVVNLFAHRARSPADLSRAADPVGPVNDRFIRDHCRAGQLVVAGWGAHKQAASRAPDVRDELARSGIWLLCFGVTQDGHPKHPLYLPRTAELRPLSGAAHGTG